MEFSLHFVQPFSIAQQGSTAHDGVFLLSLFKFRKQVYRFFRAQIVVRTGFHRFGPGQLQIVIDIPLGLHLGVAVLAQNVRGVEGGDAV